MIPETLLYSPNFPYKIEEKVGEGGMGVVYRAFEPDLHRQVAIKLLHPSVLGGRSSKDSEEARLRFLQEARAAASLAHPGITTIYRIGETSGQPYMVMEWLDGSNLDAVFRSRMLSLDEALRIGCELADTLHTAHSHGVIHRDIKPANLMFLGNGRLKVTDFGIARLEGSDLIKTTTGSLIATPNFASPEQLRGEEVDGRTDIFSAGVVLYQAITGRTPFAGKTIAEVVTSVLTMTPTSPRLLNAEVPEVVEQVIMKALAKVRENRFRDAKEFGEALHHARETGKASPAWTNGESTQRIQGSRPSTIKLTALPDREHETPAPVAVITGLSSDPSEMLFQLINTWPSRNLGRQPVLPLIDQLLDAPVHADCFAGAVIIDGNHMLLLSEGCVVGAASLSTKLRQDAAIDALPAEGEVKLHPIPDHPAVVPLLASFLGERLIRLRDLDSSFTNLPALEAKLSAENFEGVMILRHGEDSAYILMSKGRQLLTLFSGGWAGADTAQPWSSWVSDYPLLASVEETAIAPLTKTYRRLLRNFELDVVPQSEIDADASGLSGFGWKKELSATKGFRPARAPRWPRGRLPSPTIDLTEMLSRDFASRFLLWALNDLPLILHKKEIIENWKYASEWLALVTGAILHHDLPRPNEHASDLFDLVTIDNEDKVLHLAYRVNRGTVEVLEQFVNRVRDAKTARTRRGDIGGAFLIASQFDEDVPRAYQEIIDASSSASLLSFGTAEAFTGYAGFVRMASRRGFHLMLILDKGGSFEPIEI